MKWTNPKISSEQDNSIDDANSIWREDAQSIEQEENNNNL